MNRKLTAFTAAAFLCVAPAIAEEITIEQILESHYEAIGGLEAWSSVGSMKQVGKMSAPGGLEAPFTILAKAPDKARIEFTFQGMTGVQAADGEVAWQIMPFMGKTDPEPMPEDQARLMFESADFDGPLVDWEADGNRIDYEGTEEVEGTLTHKLKVTVPSGELRYYYLDAEHFLPIKSLTKTTLQGQETELENIYGDYKEVGGLVLAHSFEQRQPGAPAGQVFTIESIELNVEMADDRFSMPAATE